MLTDGQEQVLRAMRKALVPFARMLFLHGLGWREFNEIGRAAFAEAATRDYGVRGRPANLARVAAVTGLSRREVKRLRDEVESGVEVRAGRTNIVSRLLDVWTTDSRFLDRRGNPANLSEKDKTRSFSNLAKAVGGDIPVGVLRAEVLRVGCARQLANGELKFQKLFYRPEDLTDRLVLALESSLSYLAETALHNVSPQSAKNLRSEKIVYHTGFDVEDTAKFEAISREKIDKFVLEMANVISGAEEWRRDLEKDPHSRKVTGGVGVYYFKCGADE